MARLSVYRDGLALDPILSSGSSDTDTEAELRNLFDQISSSFSSNPMGNLVPEFLGFEFPKSVCIDRSELFEHWVRKFYSEVDDDPFNRRFPLCPDLKRRIKRLAHKLLSEKLAGSGDVDSWYMKERERTSSSVAASGALERKTENLEDMLTLLKDVAIDPCGQTSAFPEWQDLILKTRKALFESVDMEEFPHRKRQRTHKFLSETSRGTTILSFEKSQLELSRGQGSHEVLNHPVRRSQRTLLKLGESHLPRKRIPIGDFFQADVPDWTGPPYKKDVSDDKNDSNDSRWLGTQTWPIEGDDRQISEEVIGKGRPNSCVCMSPESVECVRFHVNSARLRLKSNLGPAFSGLGFDEMGEEVSKLWTQEEQLRFDDLVRLNPVYEYKSFWEPALKYFTSKSRQSIVSYYFNVFLLRWMSLQTRLAPGPVDSDVDEFINGRAHHDEKNGNALEASYSTYSQRRCLRIS